MATEERPAADTAARERALDPARSFIVRAPAGSGKTALLIARYLALLARVDEPEEVVAITFTRKAAGEMRERVLDALAAARHAEGEEVAGGARSAALARAALARAQARGWRIDEQPSRLRIQTIDALCHGLVRRMPWVARWGGRLETIEDAGELYLRAARELLGLLDEGPAAAPRGEGAQGEGRQVAEQAPDYVPESAESAERAEPGGRWRAALGLLLRHLDNDAPRLETLLVEMLRRRDQWLRHLGRGDAPPERRRERLEEALARAVGDALAELAARVPGPVAARLAAAAGLAAWPEPRASALPRWRELAERLLTRSGRPRARAPSPLADDPELCARLDAVRALPEPRYGEPQWRALDALLELLPVAAGLLRVVFAERGQVDFIEVAHAASIALGDEEAPSDLALILDRRIAHLLVDEFQDTSHGQHRLLERLTAGWTPGDGRTLFLVGDPMQSIYRFREAEVGLFMRAWTEGLGTVPLEPLALCANFRSRPGVVEWVNRTFERVLPAVADLTLGAVPYSSSAPHRPPGADPAVRVHALIGDDGRGEAATVLALVEEALAADREGGVAILVRARPHLAHILPALRRAGVRYRGVDIDPLASVPVVQDLLALTRACLHPADRVAWLAILRAPWCGLLLAELEALARGPRDATLLEALRDPDRVAGLGASGAARAARLGEVMERALAERGRRPLARVIERAWLALGGPACLEAGAMAPEAMAPEAMAPAAIAPAAMAAGAMADAEAFFSAVRELGECAGAAEVEGLEARLSERYAGSAPGGSPEAGGAPRVEVMTGHRAKGLEFATVILPGLGRASPPEARRLLVWSERFRGGAGSDLLMAPLPGVAGDEGEPLYRYLRGLERDKARHEARRLLYVMATRARERLHLVASVQSSAPSSTQPSTRQQADGGRPNGGLKRPGADTLLAALWPAVGPVFETARGMDRTAPGEAERPTPGRAATVARLPEGWRAPLAAPAPGEGALSLAPPLVPDPAVRPLEFAWAGLAARHAGTLVHRMLARIAQDGAARWDPGRLARKRSAWRSELALLGLAGEALDSALEHVESALERVLADPRGRWLLDGGHREAASEQALTGIADGRLLRVVLDRTFVDREGVRWVVDYKTGRHEGGDLEGFLDREQARYRPQLERYARLLGAAGERSTRLGLYFPLHTAWREWVAGAGPLDADGTAGAAAPRTEHRWPK